MSKYENGEIEVTAGGGKHSRINTAPSLLPPIAVLEIGRILKAGAEKYGVDNWRNIPVRDHLDHALKHIFENLANNDPAELINASCRLLFAVELTHLSDREVRGSVEHPRRSGETEYEYNMRMGRLRAAQQLINDEQALALETARMEKEAYETDRRDLSQ
jgi:hypothetical protein